MQLFTRLKNLLGTGPVMLLLGMVIEGLALWIWPTFSIPLALTFDLQIMLTVPCVVACLLGAIWFNHSLNLIEVHLLEGEQKLVTTGPFAYVRHPLYATLLLTLPPLMIVWFSDLLFVMPWVVLLVVSHFLVRLEERGLVEEFGAEYERYRRDGPALIPYKGSLHWRRERETRE